MDRIASLRENDHDTPQRRRSRERPRNILEVGAPSQALGASLAGRQAIRGEINNAPTELVLLRIWRTSIETHAIYGILHAPVATDMDLVNVFGYTEWHAMRDAISNELHEVSAWTE